MYLITLPWAAYANSGPAISAAPVSGISVDGNLSDWPARIERQQLAHFDSEVSGKPSKDDASADFAVGYDPEQQAIYVAVDVRDDKLVAERASQSLPNGLGTNPDGALLYLDLGHRAHLAENMEFSFVSRPIAVADDVLLPDGIVTQARRTKADGTGVNYEWRIDLPALLRHQHGARDGALKDRVIGFDVLYFDRDSEEDGSIIKWTFGPNDGEDNTVLGDLFVLNDPWPLVRVEGTTNWAASKARPPRFAHLISVRDPNFVVRGKTDSEGAFQIEAPSGEYTGRASDSRSLLRDAVPLQVEIGETPITLVNSLVGHMPEPELDILVPALMSESGVRTVGVVWVKGGKITYNRTFGIEADGDPASKATRFRVASITKPMTTMTVLGLSERGQWDLDHPLATFWTDPDLARDHRAQAITSRMVLRHLTGLANWRDASALSFLYDPGTIQSYSGEGFEFMRRALNRASGEDLETHAAREVFGPADMPDTSFRWSAERSDDFAGEFLGTGSQLSHYRGDRINAAANLLSTPTDLARFALWVLARRKANPALFAKIEEANGPDLIDPAKPDIARHGLGWIIHDKSGVRTLEHSGGQRGIRTHLVVIPERDEALIVLTNSSAGWPIIRAAFNATLNREGSLDALEQALYGTIET
ncbi:MAG: serine hydrolase [Pseudomonadota bacterium]